MDRWTRRFIERVFADRIAISKATKREDVVSLLELVNPISVPGGLKRFGPTGDGGYLMPDDIEGIRACISPGVSTECRFDEAMAAHGIDVYMADASVSGPPRTNTRFHFVPKFLDIWPSVQTMTLEELSAPVGDGDLLLQMDIEGAEYRVISALTDDLLRRFRIMVIEFHDLDMIFSRFGFSILHPVFAKLTAHHSVVHIHPNNCLPVVERYGLDVPPVMEFTFYRKDRLPQAVSPARAFPHPFDAPCVPAHPDVELPACWWQAT